MSRAARGIALIGALALACAALVVAGAASRADATRVAALIALTALAVLAVAAIASPLVQRVWRRRDPASIDPLTGARNLHYLERETDANLADPRFGAHAVVRVDVNRLAMVNDTYGHRAGDNVLIALCQRVESLLEEVTGCAPGAEGALVRLGGDRFLVVLHSPGEIDAGALRSRVEDLRRAPVQAEGSEPVPMEFSVRVASAAGPSSLAMLLAETAGASDERESRRSPHRQSGDPEPPGATERRGARGGVTD